MAGTTKRLGVWHFLCYSGTSRDPVRGVLYGYANLTKLGATRQILQELIDRRSELVLNTGSVRLGGPDDGDTEQKQRRGS